MNHEHDDRLNGLLAQAVQQLRDTPQANDQPADLDTLVLHELSRSHEHADTVLQPVSGSQSNSRFRHWRLGFARPAAFGMIVLLAVGMWSTMSSSRSLLAEALRRMEEASSVRCVLESKMPNDEWVKTWEVEFLRQRGFRELHYENSVIVQTEIDDGNNHWIYRQGRDIVTRGAAVDFTMQLQRLLSPSRGDKSFQPEPGNDQQIEGVACRCFIATWENTPSRWGQRVSLWIDHEGRAHRFLIEARQNASEPWVKYQQARVEYNIEIDGVDFSPHFPENTRIVDLAKVFDGTCSLDKAIHREVKHGYEFAVHDLKRISPLQYYILLSFRPTDELRHQLKLGPGEIPGDLHGGLRSERKRYPPGETESESANELASARADGILVKAFFCNIHSGEGSIPTLAQPEFTMFANARLWNQVPAIGEVSMKVPLPGEVTPLREVIRSVYDMIAMLETIPMELVQLKDEFAEQIHVDRQRIGVGLTLETHRKQNPRPSEISFETFLDHIQNAAWAKHTKTSEALAEERNQLKQKWGSEDPLVFLRELDAAELDRPVFWQQRLADLIQTPDPAVQIAAIEYAEKTGSLELAYFSILPTFDHSPDPSVKAAADRVLAHYRRPIETLEPARSQPFLEWPIERIEKSMKQFEASERLEEAVHELRELTGLDFGDGTTTVSRQNWSKWWSQERESINNAANGNREFFIDGRVTDINENPLSAIPIHVDVSTRLFGPIENQAAYTESDDNGHFILRFGFFKTEPTGMPIVNFKIQTTKNATSPAWGRGNCVLSRFQLNDDPLANIKQEGIIFAGRPKEMKIVLTKPEDSNPTEQ